MSLASYELRGAVAAGFRLCLQRHERALSQPRCDRGTHRVDDSPERVCLWCVADCFQSTRKGSRDEPNRGLATRVRGTPVSRVFDAAVATLYGRTRTSRRSRAFDAPHTSRRRARMSGAQMAHLGRPGRVVRAHHERRPVDRGRAGRARPRPAPRAPPTDRRPRPTTSARPMPRRWPPRPRASPDRGPARSLRAGPGPVARRGALTGGLSVRPGAPPSRPPCHVHDPVRRGRPRGGSTAVVSRTWPGGSSSTRAAARRASSSENTSSSSSTGGSGRSRAAQLVGGQAQGQGHAALLALGRVGAGRAGPRWRARARRGAVPTEVTWRRRSSARRRGQGGDQVARPTTAGRRGSRARSRPPGARRPGWHGGGELGRQRLALGGQLRPRRAQALVPDVEGGRDGAVGPAAGLAEHGGALAQDPVDLGHQRVEPGVAGHQRRRRGTRAARPGPPGRGRGRRGRTPSR